MHECCTVSVPACKTTNSKLAHVVLKLTHSTAVNLASCIQDALRWSSMSCACMWCRTARAAAKTASPGSSVATRSRADFMDNHCGSMAFSNGQNNVRSASDFRCVALVMSPMTSPSPGLLCMPAGYLPHFLRSLQPLTVCALPSTVTCSCLHEAPVHNMLVPKRVVCIGGRV